MPLIKSKSKKAFEHNLKAELAAGKPKDQALAIAYSVKRRKKMAEGGEVEKDHEHEKEMPKAEPRHANKDNPRYDEEKAAKVHKSLAKAFGFAHGGEVHHPKSIAEAIMHKKRMMAEGGEVDLQDSDDEHLNMEDQLSFDAARKHTYFDLDQIDEQPMDSNEHGDHLDDEDEHGKGMIASIMGKMRKKRM